MKVLIVEDDIIYAQALQFLVEDIGYQVIGTTNNALEAKRLIRATQPDLVLMDIQIKGEEDGITVAEDIQQKQLQIPVIFITYLRDAETFHRSKHTYPFAYITKPVDEEVLRRTIELVLHQQHAHKKKNHCPLWNDNMIKDNSLFIKVNRSIHKVPLSSVHYIHVEGKYSTIVLESGQITAKMSLKELSEKLPINMFMKVDKSSLVNLQKVSEVDIDQSTIKLGMHEVIFSKKYKKELIERLSA